MTLKKENTNITLSQRTVIGIGAGFSSSIINHPFQVLRSRFQNHVAFKEKFPDKIPPEIFTKDFKILFKGFPATLLSMCCLTVTQSIAKRAISDVDKSDASYLFLNMYASLLGGLISACLTTPLEASILRQSKTTDSDGKKGANQGVFKNAQNFYIKHGLARSYVGCSAIAIRTSIVGSGFAVWMPVIASQLDHQGCSHNFSFAVAGVIVGLMFAAASQPAETIRIEQQFSANEQTVLSMRQAAKNLIEKNGMVGGLFKGGSYRIPRTAPGVFINGLVYEKLEEYFSNSNKI